MMSGICRKEIVAVSLFVVAAITAVQSAGAPGNQEVSKPPVSLDFEFFKARVEPIFLKRRPGHARCYACHGSGTGPQYLVKLSPGSTFWTDEESRKNFQNVSKFVDRSDPMNSHFLIQPLSPMAGGSVEYLHGGGRQFESMDDPDWQTMAAWARGEKLPSSSATQ
jgi:hypothetical protein